MLSNIMKKGERSKVFGRGSTIFFKKRHNVKLVVDTTRPRTSCLVSSTNAASPPPLMIGWDDVKCRPIFKNAVDASIPLISSDESDNDEAVSNPKCTYKSAQEKEDGGKWTPKKRRKMFGFRKRQHFFPKTTTFSETTKTSTEVLKPIRIMSPQKKKPSPFPVDTNNFFASPPSRVNQNADSICNAPIERASRATVSNSTVATKTSVEPSRRRLKSQRQQPARINKRSRSSKESVLINSHIRTPTKTGQPHSTTSLSAAKAFFNRLDATTQLQIINVSSLSPTSMEFQRRSSSHNTTICRHGGRSMGPPNLRSPKLQREYQAYRKASRESGVTPLALRVYVQHRATIFRPKDMYDGFLDE